MGDRKRDEVIAFRVTAAERKQINKNIRKSGLSQREYLLNAALGQAIHVAEELKSILSELRACGRNLNQLTMLAHEGHIQTVDLWETADMLAHEGHIQTVDLWETADMLGKTYEAVNALLTAKDQVISHGNV